jgi:two-component system nitrate/nitrite sensor histidine kinase NarX
MESGEERFPIRIDRLVVQATTALVVAVLVVGGASLGLAIQIYVDNQAVTEEYRHILRLDHVHSLFDDLIFDLHQMASTGRHDRMAEALLAQEDLVLVLDALDVHRNDADGAEQEREESVLATLRRLSTEGRELTSRVEQSGRLTESDLEWLNRTTHEVPRRTEELAELHKVRVAKALRRSQDALRVIVALYVAFIVVGAALVVGAGLLARRALARPLRRLADAAGAIAEGRLDTRVRVESRDELGALAQSFNTMADRVQESQRELRQANQELDGRIREAQALYRIGTEIARLQQIDRVLQSVVDKARELLRGDVAALCLCPGSSGQHLTRATSGPPEVFRAAEEATACPALAQGGPCTDVGPIFRPGFVRAHVAASLRLDDRQVGVIHVGSLEGREFGPREADLLAGLATQAVLAIERSRLSEEVRSLGAVEERERLAREMHDGLAQTLGLLHLKLQAARARSDGSAAAGDLREAIEISAGAYEDLRQSIFGLRTFVSRGLGLVPTLTEFLHEFSVQSGISVDLEAPGGPLGPVPPATEVQAVRIIQEALTNVRKHAAVGRARVRLQRDGAWLRVAVEDDGDGWDGPAAPAGLHFGLKMMRERAEGLGGRLEVESAPGRGTRVVATLPGGSA